VTEASTGHFFKVMRSPPARKVISSANGSSEMGGKWRRD
jgi:hypothetical protein